MKRAIWNIGYLPYLHYKASKIVSNGAKRALGVEEELYVYGAGWHCGKGDRVKQFREDWEVVTRSSSELSPRVRVSA